MDRPESLADFTGPSKESGEQIVYQHCPVCGSRGWKVYVNPVTGLWWCHAGNHTGGGRIDVGMPLAGRGQAIRGRHAPQERPRWTETGLPSWQPLGWRALRYLAARGIDKGLAASLGIVEMEERMRVLVPYLGPAGGVIYWTARSYTDLEEGPKYLAAGGKHPLYVLPDWQPREDVVLVEGVFDAIAVHEATGSAAIAVGGKSLPRYLEPDLLDLAHRSITILLDADAAADAYRLRKRLMFKRKMRVVPLPPGEDPSSMGDSLKGLLS